MTTEEIAVRRAQAKIHYQKATTLRQTEDWKKRNRAKVIRCLKKRAVLREQGIEMSQKPREAPIVDIETWYKAQPQSCCICGRTDSLCMDHCHSTGQVRGLLCPMCNTGLGCFADDIQRLQAAIRYLRKHMSQEHDSVGPNPTPATH